MKSKWLIVVGAVLAVVVAAERYGRPVMAEVRAALVQNVDEPGRNPFAFSAFITQSQGPTTTTFSVPAGKRYVVQQFSAQCTLTPTSTPFVVTLQGTTNGTSVQAYAPSSLIGSLFDLPVFAGRGTTPLYADPGSSLTVGIATQVVVNDCSYSVSGYVINNP